MVEEDRDMPIVRIIRMTDYSIISSTSICDMWFHMDLIWCIIEFLWRCWFQSAFSISIHIFLDNSQIIVRTTTGSGHGQYGMGIWSVDTFSDTIHTPVGKRIIAFHNTIESAVESVFMGWGDTRNWVIAYNAFAGSKWAAISIQPGADNRIPRTHSFKKITNLHDGIMDIHIFLPQRQLLVWLYSYQLDTTTS